MNDDFEEVISAAPSEAIQAEGISLLSGHKVIEVVSKTREGGGLSKIVEKLKKQNCLK